MAASCWLTAVFPNLELAVTFVTFWPCERDAKPGYGNICRINKCQPDETPCAISSSTYCLNGHHLNDFAAAFLPGTGRRVCYRQATSCDERDSEPFLTKSICFLWTY